MGLGATGLTFFDDEVTQFFSPQRGGQERHVPDTGWRAAEAAAGHAGVAAYTVRGVVGGQGRVGSAESEEARGNRADKS